MIAMHAAVPGFTLPRIDGPPVSLDELLHDGPLVLVFAHADCPTSALKPLEATWNSRMESPL